MRVVLYALRFQGQAEPVGVVGNVWRTTTTAPSSALTSTIGPDGVVGVVAPITGEEASCASEVTFTGETSFQEVGAIRFGDGHHLRFATVGSGYLTPSADPTRRHGAAMWRVTGGEGQFAGASGLITANFFIDDALGIVAHHFGVIVLP